MYKYKAEIQNKKDGSINTDNANNIATLLRTINQSKNVLFSIFRTKDSKLMMKGSK